MTHYAYHIPYFFKLKPNDPIEKVPNLPPGNSFKKRRHIADWIRSEVRKYPISQRIFQLSVILLDKYHTLAPISEAELELTAKVCVYIADTCESPNHIPRPKGNPFLVKLYSVLNTLNWEVDYDTPYDKFLAHIKDHPIKKNVRFLSVYLLSIYMMSTHYLLYEPTKLVKYIIDFSTKVTDPSTDLETFIKSDINYMLCWMLWQKVSKWSLMTHVKASKLPTLPQVTGGWSLGVTIDQIKETILATPLNALIQLESDSTQNKIGRGVFGSVYQVDLTNGMRVAAKRYDLPEDGTKEEELETHCLRELNILKFVNHPNIVKLYGYEVNSGFELNIFFELLDQTLEKHLKLNPKLPGETRRSYMSDLMKGLTYLHSNGIIHCDLTSKNVMITQGQLKIIDLGMSRRLTSSSRTVTMRSTTCALWYRPLEILQGKKTFQFEFDMWSAGCVCYYMFSGKDIFEHDFRGNDALVKLNEEQRMLHAIKIYKKERLDNLSKSYPRETKLIRRMLVDEPKMRITANNVQKQMMKEDMVKENIVKLTVIEEKSE
jgi:hypothetical protein